MNQDKSSSPKTVEKAYEDCYYFLYSTCKRGDSCIYRHCQEARASTKLCPEWDKTKKCELNCPLRHSYYHLQKKRSNDMCYFEETPQGCTKQHCEYKHKDSSRDAWKYEEDTNNSANPQLEFMNNYQISVDHNNQNTRQFTNSPEYSKSQIEYSNSYPSIDMPANQGQFISQSQQTSYVNNNDMKLQIDPQQGQYNRKFEQINSHPNNSDLSLQLDPQQGQYNRKFEQTNSYLNNNDMKRHLDSQNSFVSNDDPKRKHSIQQEYDTPNDIKWQYLNPRDSLTNNSQNDFKNQNTITNSHLNNDNVINNPNSQFSNQNEYSRKQFKSTQNLKNNSNSADNSFKKNSKTQAKKGKVENKDDSEFIDKLKAENKSLLNAIEEIEKEIAEADNFLLKFKK